ncbi:MAG: NADH-quinone oxidoreductase subunit N [Verrucomicrobiota bacterium JB022]|nr:NADH-quinone oxidoreductase subunit N [Verrucomicrobiota bacterium JB022]
MDAQLQILSELSSSHHWSWLLPEIILAALALVLLAVELFVPKSDRWLLRIAIGGQAAIFAGLIFAYCTGKLPTSDVALFAGAIQPSDIGHLMRIFFVGCSTLVCFIGYLYLQNRPLARAEFYHLVMIITAAMMLLAQTTHFVSFFVALETVTIGFYILVAYGRNSSFSLEAGLKYLIMGGFSSGLLLFGIVLLYGAAGNPDGVGTAIDPFQFDQLGSFIAQNTGNPLVVIGALLVVVGICFKIGSFPFQYWIPDVYQGAPTPTTAFLAVSSKSMGFFLLYALLTGPFLALEATMVPIIGIMTLLTIAFGNIAAIGQQNVKRVMGLSGVAHAGILLVGILAAMRGVDWAFAAVFFYLVTYALASFAVFGVMAHVATGEDAAQDRDLYLGLMQRSPFLGGILAVGLGSLAGIPPLAGFVAKAAIIVAAFQAKLYLLVAFVLIGVVISIYYYFGWLRAAVSARQPELQGEPAPILVPTFGSRALLTGLALASVVLGLYQGGLLS